MFARIVELTAKTGKARELVRMGNDEIVSIMRDQPGFVDEIILQSQDDPNRLLALSFWRTRRDADTYNLESFPRITEMIRNLVEIPPQVRTFDVTTSTAHNISAAERAA
jgi:heme-degrading monooxygenase HmoA